MIKEISIVGILGAWYVIKKKWEYLCRIAEPVVKKYEQQALDGVIDKADRKELAMEFIKSLEADGKLKLNFITRRILSLVVDKVADKLPNFVVSQEVVTTAEKK